MIPIQSNNSYWPILNMHRNRFKDHLWYLSCLVASRRVASHCHLSSSCRFPIQTPVKTRRLVYYFGRNRDQKIKIYSNAINNKQCNQMNIIIIVIICNLIHTVSQDVNHSFSLCLIIKEIIVIMWSRYFIIFLNWTETSIRPLF